MKLSVIVCTRNRASSLIECVNSIAAALSNAAPVEAEIVIVDNASEDNTSALIREWASSCAFPVQLLMEKKRGLGPARNCGIRHAKGDLLVFTDDDCRLSPGHIKDALRHDAGDKEFVLRGGRVELGDPTDLPITVKTEDAVQQWSRGKRSAKYADLSHTIIGCNFTIRRKAADHIGPFDERFGAGTSIPAGEDTDYIYRAYLADMAIEYVPDMAVLHYHGRKDMTQSRKLFRNYLIGAGALYAKYLFKDIDIVRPVYWNVKHAFRELYTGRNEFMKTAGISYRKLVYYCIIGATRYYIGLLKKSA